MLIKKNPITACQNDVTFHSYLAAAAFAQELAARVDVFQVILVDTKVRFISVDAQLGDSCAKDFEERWIARMDAACPAD